MFDISENFISFLDEILNFIRDNPSPPISSFPLMSELGEFLLSIIPDDTFLWRYVQLFFFPGIIQ